MSAHYVPSIRRRSELLGLRSQLAFRLFRLRWKYNPDQPRDEFGRWSGSDGDDSGAAVDPGDTPMSIEQIAARRSRRLEAECDEQLKRDIFQCNMVGLRACYAQAAERYSACLVGRPIPPFNY